MSPELPTPSRRGVLTAAGAVGAVLTVGACASYGTRQDGTAAPAPAPVTVPADGGGGVDDPAPAGALAQVSDIPVGGGVVFAAEQVVVTQPTQGALLAFSAVCTHQGCLVNSVQGGRIQCPCHGSQFNLDGTVARGPAPQALAARTITVQGGAVVLG